MKRGLLLLFGLILCANTLGCCCANPRPFWHRPCWGKWWGCGSCACGNYCDDIDDCSMGGGCGLPTCGSGRCKSCNNPDLSCNECGGGRRLSGCKSCGGCSSCGDGDCITCGGCGSGSECTTCGYFANASCNHEGCGYGLGDTGPGSCNGCSHNKYYGDWWAGRPRCWDPCDWCGNWTGPVRPPMRRKMARYGMPIGPTSYYNEAADMSGEYEVIDEGPVSSHPTPAPKKSAPAPTPKTSAKPRTTPYKTVQSQPAPRVSKESTSKGNVALSKKSSTTKGPSTTRVVYEREDRNR